MNAREAILGALGPDAEHARIADEARALIDAPERPSTPGELKARFLEALAQPSVAASCDHLASGEPVSTAIGRYLDRHALPHAVMLADPALASEGDWKALQLLDAPPVDGGVVVARALAAVAETGSLVLETGAERPMLPHFLALHHIVLVSERTIVAHLEDIAQPPAPPRAQFWVTGVSGTTDIEGQYVRGAHGPRFLHVILTD